MKQLKTFQTVAAALVMAVFLAACSTTQPNDELVRAQETVQQASESQSVNEHAPSQLDRAKRSLRMAESDWQEHGEDREEQVEHLAYMAHQQALTAMERAQAAEAREEINNMESRRKDVLLQARNRELEQRNQELQELREEKRNREQEAEELRNMVETLQAKATERGLVLTLDEILFGLNETELKPGGVNAINRLAEFLKENPDRNILIEGHTDSLGDDGYNMQLSRQRAEAVERQLMEFGIDTNRINTRGYGEQFPVASNDNSAGRQQNRRVEIIIGDEGETPEYRPTATTSSR